MMTNWERTAQPFLLIETSKKSTYYTYIYIYKQGIYIYKQAYFPFIRERICVKDFFLTIYTLNKHRK